MPPKDLVVGRGQRKSTPLGTSVFVGLRAVDPLLQSFLLLSSPLAALLPRLGISQPFSPPAAAAASTSSSLTPFQTVIWAMSIGSALKQIIWILYISNEPMYPSSSLMICAFNTAFNSINSLLATAELPYQYLPQQVYLGGALFGVGILVELVSELQRKRFKDDPANKGKPYAGGFFNLARSINYGGYTLWRGGYALAAGGPTWGILAAFLLAYDFAARAIPVMDEYCSKRYGVDWEEVKKKVQYKLLPFVY